MEQHHTRFLGGDFLPHHGESGELLRVHRVRRRLGHGRVEIGIAVLGAGLDRDEVALGQPAPGGGAADLREIGEPAGAVLLDELPRGHLRAGLLQRELGVGRQRGGERLDPEALLERGIGAAHGLGQDAHQRDGERRGIILRHPLRELDQDGGQERLRAENLDQVLELALRRLVRELDHVPDDLARAERNAHLRAKRDLRVEFRRHGIIERAIEGNFGNNASDAGHGPSV